MKKIKFVITIVVISSLFSGCALNKMIKLAKQQELQVSPNPLEVHGNDVKFDMSAVLPPKNLKKRKVYTINTTYQYGDKEIEVGNIEFKAEDYPMTKTTVSKASKSFSMAYDAGFNPGSLMIQGIASNPKNGKAKRSDKMEVAVGIITTSRAVKDSYATSYADHGYNYSEELIPTNVDFYFSQGSSYLSQSIATDGKTNKSKQTDLTAFIAEKNVTRTVTITGTHSPEGSETVNGDLSENRAKQIEKYYRAQMAKYDYKGEADGIKFIIKPVVQDWTSFKMALRETSLSDASKAAYLNIINGSGSFVDKEKSMKKLPDYKEVFKTVYPKLRTAQTEILTVKLKKSAAEISLLAKQIVNGEASNDVLSTEEFLYAATLTPSLKEKEGIYIAASKKDGNWVAHNNLAAVYLEMAAANSDNAMKYVQDALTQIAIAANKSDDGTIHANMGTALIMEGSYSQAYDALVKADESATNELKSNISSAKGSLEIRMGDYDKASASLTKGNNSDVSNFNRGLANLLTNDFDGADRELNKVTGSTSVGSHALYLKAVSAARNKNNSGVLDNLKAAVAKDASLKEMALSDLEFKDFAVSVSEAIR
jgi:Tfp pilus assembly protein PilF